MSDINTEKLVESVKNGDKSAADEIYRQYSEPLTKFVIKQGLSEFDAQDVVSDTFVEMMKHIDQLKDPSAFSSWIHTIAKRKAWEAKEKLARRQDLAAGAEDPDDSTDPEQAVELAHTQANEDSIMLPEDYAVNEDLKQLIAEQLDALGADYKEALFLFYYKDKSIAEIAEITGTNTNNVKQRLYAARKKLKANLEKLQKSGVVLCAVPFTRFIPFCAENFGGAVGAVPSGAAASGAAAKSAAAKTAGGTTESIAAKAASAAAKMGTGAKAAVIVAAAAAVVGVGIYAAGRPQKDRTISDNGNVKRVEVRDVTPAKPRRVPENVTPAEPVPDERESWRQSLIDHLTENYGTADGLRGVLYDTDGDDIPEAFVCGRIPQNLGSEGQNSQTMRVYTGRMEFGCLWGSSGISSEKPDETEIWCSGDPSPDNLLCLTANENVRRICRTKSVDGLSSGEDLDEAEAKAIYDFDTQPHRLIADKDRGYEDIGDFTTWVNSWNGNFDTVTEDAPELTYGKMNVWQKAYFDHVNLYAEYHKNVRCALFDVNGDGVPELLEESYESENEDGKRIGCEAELATCNESGELDTLLSQVSTDPGYEGLAGGFTFTGTSDGLFSVYVKKGSEYPLYYDEHYHWIENGHFEFDGRGCEFAYDSDGNIVYLNMRKPTDEERFKRTHYGFLGSENAVTTCPGSFDRQADITWFDTLHKTEMMLDYASRTNNN